MGNSSECPETISISSQEDVDNTNFTCASFLNLVNATGDLNFSTLTRIVEITVHDSPHLQSLSIPNLTRIYSWFDIKNATSLTNISMPRLGSEGAFLVGSGAVSSNNVSVSIVGVPSITDIDFGGYTTFQRLILGDFGSYSQQFENITTVFKLALDGCFFLSELENTFDFQATRWKGCLFPGSWSKLRSVMNLTLSDSDVHFFSGEVQVNETLTITETNGVRFTDRDGRSNGIRFSAIGSNINMSANADSEFQFERLTNIVGDLFVYNNTNCNLSFEQLSDVSAISMIDNTGTILPRLPKLQSAKSIHMRGRIDTSGGPNIFPALITVPGNVTIEAWNDDFNCSKLVNQFQNGQIHFLSCNGTDNGTESLVVGPIESTRISQDHPPSTLSQGAWAGIGVGIGVFVIGMICGLVGLFLRSKRWNKELIERIRQQETQARQEHLRDSLEMEHEAPNLNLICESDGTGIIREKPDDHLSEAGGIEVVAEHPDDHIHELPVPPAELPGTTDIKRT
ncbi:hypothetical protein K445DRAFT_304793 [Daldinia sp. EC12]|nr:hypothetical protein K445DRAFT_304793 [Daldinia sp. EC12]